MNADMLADFVQRKLPLSEYITEAGLHPMGKAADGIEDAPYLIHKYLFSCSAKYEFPNGKGCSVISGSQFYCDDEHPFEVMVHGDTDPHGYMNEADFLLLLVSLRDGTYEGDSDE